MTERFDIVETRAPEGLAVYVRSSESQRLFRVAPARDPEEPRFWCLRIDWCLRPGPIGGAGDHAEIYVAARGMTREQLMTALQEIRANPETWLGESRQQELRRWLLDKCAVVLPPTPATPARAGALTGPRATKEETDGEETTVSPARAAS
jgi:hypothetical protein